MEKETMVIKAEDEDDVKIMILDAPESPDRLPTTPNSELLSLETPRAPPVVT